MLRSHNTGLSADFGAGAYLLLWKISRALSSIERRAPDISHESKFSLAKAAPKSARPGAGCQVPWQVFAQSLPQFPLPLCSNLLIGHQHHNQSIRLTLLINFQSNEPNHHYIGKSFCWKCAPWFLQQHEKHDSSYPTPHFCSVAHPYKRLVDWAIAITSTQFATLHCCEGLALSLQLLPKPIYLLTFKCFHCFCFPSYATFSPFSLSF